MTVTFWLTSLLVVATPGTGAIYTIAAGLGRGPRAGVLAAAASTIGVLPHLLLAVSGLAALMRSAPVVMDVVRYAGVAYLLYMAWMTWRDRSILTADGKAVPMRRMIRDGVMLNLLNPKLTVFFVAFLPQFSGPTGSVGTMLILGGAFVALTFVVFAAYGVCAGAVRRVILERPRIVDGLRRAFSIGFAALALRLLVD